MNPNRDQFPLNSHGERLECVGEITLNLEYWDCECERNFIHPIFESKCPVCDSEQEESPASRENEVDQVLGR